ncbi:hypothetical protein MLD52_23230, partial [Puniceicoccaceae bacterium K14]|nr:hypothetical protein [Puniceicoccaceae bacterium K14]
GWSNRRLESTFPIRIHNENSDPNLNFLTQTHVGQNKIEMAIYIGLKSIEENEKTKMYSFFDCNGKEHGILGYDKETKEIELLRMTNERVEIFSYPKAKKALLLELEKGILPDELAYKH